MLLPENEPPQDGNVSLLAVEQMTWQGPLPHPAHLAQFDEVIQNGAERVFRMAELEQADRINQERIITEANIAAQNMEYKATARGQWLGAAISIFAIATAVWTAINGADWRVSVALVGIPLMAAVKAIIIRK